MQDMLTLFSLPTTIATSFSSIWATTWQNQQNECAPSEDSDQPGHQPSLIRVFAVRMKKAWVLSCSWSAQRRLIRLGGCPGWSSSSLSHSHFVGFVMSQLTWKSSANPHQSRRNVHWFEVAHSLTTPDKQFLWWQNPESVRGNRPSFAKHGKKTSKSNSSNILLNYITYMLFLTCTIINKTAW